MCFVFFYNLMIIYSFDWLNVKPLRVIKLKKSEYSFHQTLPIQRQSKKPTFPNNLAISKRKFEPTKTSNIAIHAPGLPAIVFKSNHYILLRDHDHDKNSILVRRSFDNPRADTAGKG